jgi:HSP20 family protein
MNTFRGIKLRWLHETLGHVTHQMTRVHFVPWAPPSWAPAINAFQCDHGLHICVELAGVDRSEVELILELQRLVIRGTRAAPEPTGVGGDEAQMLAFEIDYGPFERVVELPAPIDAQRARAEQKNGFLWIELPFRQ